MSYRDETEALHARVESLERELSVARSALAVETAVPASIARTRHMRGASLAVGVSGVFVLSLGFMLTWSLRAPFDVLLVAFGVVGVLLLTLACTVLALSLRVVAEADEAVVVAGGARLRVVMPGEGAIVLPLLHQARVLSLVPRAVSAEIDRVFVREGAAIDRVRATVGVRVAPERAAIEQAAQRFLRDAEAARAFAEGALTQAVRSAFSELRVVELEREYARVCAHVEAALSDELSRAGLHVQSGSFRFSL